MALHNFTDSLGERLFDAVSRRRTVELVDREKPIEGNHDLFLPRQGKAAGPAHRQLLVYLPGARDVGALVVNGQGDAGKIDCF